MTDFFSIVLFVQGSLRYFLNLLNVLTIAQYEKDQVDALFTQTDNTFQI